MCRCQMQRKSLAYKLCIFCVTRHADLQLKLDVGRIPQDLKKRVERRLFGSKKFAGKSKSSSLVRIEESTVDLSYR